MNATKVVISLLPALALTLVTACGIAAKAQKVGRGSNRSADASDKAAVTLDVASPIKDGASTNSGKHLLTTNIAGNNTLNTAAPGFVAKLKTKVTVTSPSGADVPVADEGGNAIDGGTQSGASSKWTILLDEKGGSSEGVYKIVVAVVAPGTVDQSIIAMPKEWTANVTLDLTPPVVGIRAALISSLETGARTLTVHSFVANKAKATCETAELRTSDSGASLPLTLTQVQDDDYAKSATIPPGSLLFVQKDVSVPDNLHDPFTVYAKCTDAAGNASEFILPVNASSSPFLFTAVAQGNIGTLPNSQATAAYVKPGTLKVDLALTDAKTGAKTADLFTSREQALLRVTVTDTAIASLAELQAIKTPIWSQVYTPVMSFPMSTGYDGQKTLYVSMVLHDLNTNTDQLLGTVPLNIFVVAVAPSVAWTGKPQFVPYAASAAITGQFIVTLTEAPLANSTPMVLEFSTDNATWTALPATFAKLTTTNTPYEFSATYPLQSESPFRVRVKVTDLGGNVTTSAVSPNIIGRPSLTGLSIAASERATKGGNADFTPWLASATLCRIADVNGVQSGSYYVQLVVQNRGAAAMVYHPLTGGVPPGMGYSVLFSDTVPLVQNRIAPPTGLMLATTDVGLYQFPVPDAWLTPAKVTIRFGLESTGSTSLDNQYAPSGVMSQDVVIQDKAAGLTLNKGAFACDATQLIAP